MASAKPTQPPSGADMNALVVKVNEVASKVGVVPLVSKMANWKRWVGSEAEYDGKGLRDVVTTNAIYTDAIKNDLDSLRGTADTRLDNLNTRVAALENAPNSPFPA